MFDSDEDVLKIAKEHYDAASKHWEPIFRKAAEDLHFLSDEEYAQWPENVVKDRLQTDSEVITVDQLGQFVHQVSNDIRMNTPNINVIPVDDNADIATAEILSGRIKSIEYKSNADSAYDLAADFSVKSSIGFIRVDHRYRRGSKTEQELFIDRVTNPSAILLDPNSRASDGSDARYGFVKDEITKQDFKKKYPDYNAIGFDQMPYSGQMQSDDSDKIVIVEYFRIVESEEGSEKVMRYILSGENVLEQTTFPGCYVPLVPVYGEESWIGGQRNIYSLIRKAKKSQYMFNLWKSTEADLLLKQPHAPVTAAIGQLAGFENDWRYPRKAIALYYHQKDAAGDPAPAPQRLLPPQIPTGIVNASRETVDDIKATLGMYNASLGAKSNETSGVAINARKNEGDVATYHFGDNLVRSVCQVGKILVIAIPEIEDTARIVTIIDKEENHKRIGINGALIDDQKETYDFSKGAYDCRVIAGPSFTTQRQEAAQLNMQLLQSMPDLMPVIGDLAFKYQDAPGSQAISARLRKIVDPKLLSPDERKEQDEDPQIMQAQQQIQQITAEAQQALSQAQQQIAELQQELKNNEGDLQVKMAELQIKQQELQVKAADVQIKAMQSQKIEAPDSYEQSLKEREMRLKEAQFEVESVAKQVEMQMRMIEAQNSNEAKEDVEHSEESQQEENAEMAARVQQTQILAQGMAAIQASLERLNQNIEQPISIIRNENGDIVGAA